MNVYYADTPDDYADWLDAWHRSEGQEPFAHPAYAGLWADDKTRACAAVYVDGQGTVLLPFLLRDISREPFWSPDVGPAFDLITPYGYGGPVAVWPEGAERNDAPNRWEGSQQEVEGRSPKAEREKVFRDFYKAFAEWAHTHDVVSEFVRFSLFSKARPWYYGTVEHHNDNVVARLDVTKETLWRSFRRKVRYRVGAARRKGLVVEEDDSGTCLEEFIDVYYMTMDRLGAKQFYYFDNLFFRKLIRELPGQFRFFYARNEGQIVASLLVLCGSQRVYSFLSGGKARYFHLSGNDMLQVHSMQWAQQQGYKEYVLGGGLSRGDGIFVFKEAFAPKGIVPFYTGKMVFDTEKYRLLCKAAGKSENGFFPAYRK